METVQFYLSRLAAETVDVDHLKFRARDHGIAEARAETSYFRAGGRCRVTCRLPIAELLEQELRIAIDRASRQDVRDECTRALAAIAEAKQILNRLPPPAGTSFYAG